MFSISAAVYELVEASDGTFVKMFPAGTAREKVDQEVEKTMLARRYGLETPFVRGTVEVDGAPGIVFDKVYGPTFTRWMIDHPGWLMRLTEFFAHEHHEMHMHKVPELPRLKDVLGNAIAGSDAAREEREELLKKLARMPDGDWLCHMSYVPDGIMVSIDGPVIFNWGGAMRGDYLADVAMTSILLEGWEPRPEEGEAEQFKELFRRGYEFEYLKSCNRGQNELDAWTTILRAALSSR